MKQRIGPYAIERRLAVGGLGEIYLARLEETSAGTPQTVALKVLLPQFARDPEQRQLFLDEARILSQLHHPSIVSVHDTLQAGDDTVIVMEWVDGADLSLLLRRAREIGARFPLDVAAAVTIRLCDALHYSHTATDSAGRPLELVHRDVNPHNIMLTHAGEVKLIDFGVAKSSGGVRMDTRTGFVKGKLQYMAPEYAAGRSHDPRSDIFSAGLCLYEMVTGRPAYEVDDPTRLVEGVKTANMPRPTEFRPDIPPLLVDIMSRSLKRSPDDRYASAAAMKRALEGFMVRESPNWNRSAIAELVGRLALVPSGSALTPRPDPASRPTLVDPRHGESTSPAGTVLDTAVQPDTDPEGPTAAHHDLLDGFGEGDADEPTELHRDLMPPDVAPTQKHHDLASLADLAEAARNGDTGATVPDDIAVMETVLDENSDAAPTAVLSPDASSAGLAASRPNKASWESGFHRHDNDTTDPSFHAHDARALRDALAEEASVDRSYGDVPSAESSGEGPAHPFAVIEPTDWSDYEETRANKKLRADSVDGKTVGGAKAKRKAADGADGIPVEVMLVALLALLFVALIVYTVSSS